MNYCYSIENGLFDEEREYAKALKNYLFYDERQDVFLDKNNQIVDIKDKKIFPRTGALQAISLIEAIERHKGISIITSKDYEKCLNWPNYVKTKRRNMIFKGKKIMENPQKIIEMFGKDRIFFKTKFKNYSQVISVELLFDRESAFYQALETHQEDDFIISDVVDIVEDKAGSLEYRAYVIEGQLFNISRVHDYLLERIPNIVVQNVQTMIDSLKEIDFINSYVIDFFVCNGKDGITFIDVLECNPIIASGTYLYNSIFEKSTDLAHTCPSASIPLEKIKYGPVTKYSFDVEDKLIPSICYNLPGGFATDILSFSIFGSKSQSGQFFHVSTSGLLDLEDIAETHGTKNKVKVLTSDKDLENFDS